MIKLILFFWRDKHKLVFICLLFLFLSCTNNFEASIETPINIKKEEPITIATLHEITSIPDGYIYALSWDKQNNLQFRINQEDWSANAMDLNVVQINQNTDDDTPSNQFEELPPIPDGILESSQTLLSTSPSGRIHIFIEYVEQLPESEQIDGEQVVGEVIYAPAPLMIGIFHDGKQKLLGTIFSCRYDKPTLVTWAGDEHSFAIRNNCPGNPRAWLYSFDHSLLQEIDSLGGFTYIHGFSPNAQYLLYSNEWINENVTFLQLHLIRLSDLSSWKLDDLSFAHPVDWLSEHEILVIYSTEAKASGFYQIGIYNINNDGSYNILAQNFQDLLQNKRILNASLSQDKSYVAFTTMVRPFQESDLWIGKLDSNQ